MFKRINLLYVLYLRSKQMLRRGDTNQYEKIYKHTDSVKKLKTRIFYLIALLLICASVFPFLNLTGSTKFNFQTSQGEISGEAELAYDKPVVVNPRYSGIDANNRPFKLTAARGVSEDKTHVRLEEIIGQITLKDGSYVDIKSKVGEYNLKSKILKLSQGVELKVSTGYVALTEAAVVQTDENMASGNLPVTIEGSLGNLYSKGGFTIKDSGEKIFFHGGVKMLIKPEQVEKGQEKNKEEENKSTVEEEQN